MHSTSTWLFVAAAITALFALGHTLGYPWTPVRTPAAEGVVAAMAGVHFTVEGQVRSYLDFYRGFGWASGLLTGLFAPVLLRQGLAARRAPVDRALIAIECAGFALYAVLVARFIAPLPASFAVLVALALGAALLARDRPRG